MRLSARRLNRATLARQLLLKRADLDLVAAVERIAGLQAQEPVSPFVALWTRLQDFQPGSLTAALVGRDLVKATLHRSTLHIVSANDYLASLPALRRVTRTRWMHETRGRPVLRSLPDLAAESLAYASEPRTNVELRDHAGTLGEPVPADELWRRIRRYAPFVHVPTDDTWAFGQRPVQVAGPAWISGPDTNETASLGHILRRYLGAFGPAQLADVAQWSGLTVTRLREGLSSVDDLVTHEDEHGREIYDLEGAPLPHADTPAPPRLLPMWDETLLAYQDRSRVLPETYRKRVIVRAGDVLPTFTVDGLVAGLWWAEPDPNAGSRIKLEPFEPLAQAAQDELERECRRLSASIGAREPAIYDRYRWTRRRT